MSWLPCQDLHPSRKCDDGFLVWTPPVLSTGSRCTESESIAALLRPACETGCSQEMYVDDERL